MNRGGDRGGPFLWSFNDRRGAAALIGFPCPGELGEIADYLLFGRTLGGQIVGKSWRRVRRDSAR